VGVRVLMELGRFRARTADELYAGARALDWREHLTVKTTFAVAATIRETPDLRHSGFVALKVKDAIADALRAAGGARPNVNAEDPDVSVMVHLAASEAAVYLDLSGQPLHRRGYRVAMSEAPLKETLAAAVLALGGAHTEAPFFDPMCGSGTLAIEQALRARRIAPGLGRGFGFERWPAFKSAHARTWANLREEARAAAMPRAEAPIWAGDVDPAAAEATRRNAAAARVSEDLRIEVGDVSRIAPPARHGTLCTNPPYGERMAAGPPGREPARAPDGAPLARLYQELGAALRRFGAWRGVILSGNPLWSRVVLRKPEIVHRLWNGPLEVRLLVYAAKPPP
jgi:putative N6-adenine-specific DNA methylase